MSLQKQNGPGMLVGGYKALDLTDEKGLLCGKVLGDLGVDVIKVEKPGGDPARSMGPFYKDTLDPEKSLYWFAYNTSKRGITLNIETADGREIFKKLAEKTDIVIESFAPGYLDKLGLGYPQLSQINPRIILASITPFGISGPYRNYKAPDIIVNAASGLLYLTGDPDRCPIVPGFPHAHCFAALDAVIGILSALYYRHETGEGQQVYTSAQSSLYSTTYYAVPFWMSQGVICHREGTMRRRPENNVVYNINWRCKDGYVTFYYQAIRSLAKANKAMVDWIDSEGIECDFLKQIDWDTFDMGKVTQEDIDRMEKPTAELCMRYTKQELYEVAIERRVLLFPVATAKDTLESSQLASRDYWKYIEHPELGCTITYPGPFVKASESPLKGLRRAPLIGEHNEEVYQEDLGLTKQELIRLRQRKII